MSEDFESRLRAALKPVAPSDDFTQDLIARVTAAQGPQSAQRALNRQRRGASAAWFAAAAAASLLIAVGVQQHLRQQHDRAQGLEARRQVIEALRVTSQKLDLAYQAIKSQSSSVDDEQGV
jgi:methylthioribose-1-phosphate isomerase